MIWRSGFVYAHSPLPRNLDGRKFDLVFLFAHSPFPSSTSVSFWRAWLHLSIRLGFRNDLIQINVGAQVGTVVLERQEAVRPCRLLRATKRKVSARVDPLQMQLSLQKCPAIMKSDPALLLA
jgi:hypothetical protein